MPMGDREVAYLGKNVKVDFQLDVAGIARIAMRKELKDAVHDIAENRAMPYAVRISPRSNVKWASHEHYQDQFKVVDGTAVINQMRRVAARLWNFSDHAIIVEFGNKAGKRHRVLGRTLNYLNGPVVGELESDRLDRKHTENLKRAQQRRANRARALANKRRKDAQQRKENGGK